MDDDKIKKLEERLKNRHSDRTYNFFRPVGQIIEHVDTINFTMDKDGTFHFENIGQVNAATQPIYENEDTEEDQPEDNEGDDDGLATVKKCFKFTNEFTKEKVKTILDLYYQNSNPELAVIEIALYDHDLLRNRNDHKPFLEALAAWGLLDIANDEVMKTMLSSIRHKHSSLPKEGGYKGWGPKFQNEKNTCTNIGNELGETMPYRYKKKE